MEFRKIKPIRIKKARLIFRNFSGKPDEVDANGGRRKFGVIIDPAVFDLDALFADGWNIKTLAPLKPDGDPLYYLPVKVQFNPYPPDIFLIVGGKYAMRDEYGNPIPLDEDAVGTLDRAELENVKLVITPYCWERNNKSGVSAYLKTGYFEIAKDEFADDYE